MKALGGEAVAHDGSVMEFLSVKEMVELAESTFGKFCGVHSGHCGPRLYRTLSGSWQRQAASWQRQAAPRQPNLESGKLLDSRLESSFYLKTQGNH